MRKLRFLLAILFATVVVASPAIAAPLIPKELTEEHITQIEQNCRQVQVSLRSVQRGDTVLRINRGRLYDLTLRQTEAFVKRLDVHKIEAPAVKKADAAMRTEFLAFRISYDAYAESVSAALSMNCTAKPKEFYEILSRAAEQRAQVAKNVAAMNTYFSDYIKALSDVRAQRFPVGEGAND